jgi:hypothetical protein
VLTGEVEAPSVATVALDTSAGHINARTHFNSLWQCGHILLARPWLLQYSDELEKKRDEDRKNGSVVPWYSFDSPPSCIGFLRCVLPLPLQMDSESVDRDQYLVTNAKGIYLVAQTLFGVLNDAAAKCVLWVFYLRFANFKRSD